MHYIITKVFNRTYRMAKWVWLTLAIPAAPGMVAGRVMVHKDFLNKIMETDDDEYELIKKKIIDIEIKIRTHKEETKKMLKALEHDKHEEFKKSRKKELARLRKEYQDIKAKVDHKENNQHLIGKYLRIHLSDRM